MTPVEADRALENAIDQAALQLQAARTPAARRAAWDRLQSLHKQRSPQQVARMERERFGQSFSGREAMTRGQ